MIKKAGIISLFFIFLLCVLLANNHLLFAQKFLTQEESACHFLDKGEIDKALEILQDELKINPDNLSAHLYLGIALYLKKDLERASGEFEKIEKEIDRMLGSSRPFGDEAMFTEMGMDRKAEVLFSDERKGLLYFCRGLTLKEKKDLKNAEKKFKKALKLKYNEISTRLQLIDLYIGKKDLKSAAKELEELKKISGESGRLALLDGYLSYKNKRFEEALAAFEKSASSSLEARRNIASIHYNSGNYQKAVEVWEEILSNKLDDKEALINIGRASFHLGELEKAQEYFSKASLKISPEEYSPKKIPLGYGSLLKDVKFNLMCKTG